MAKNTRVKKRKRGVRLKAPHQTQREILESSSRFKVVSCGRRYGKDLALNTPIYSLNKGWTVVGEIEVGDYLVGSDGSPTKVIYLPPIKEKAGYKFTFSTGEIIHASETHDWVTYGKLCRKNLARSKTGEIRSQESLPKKLTSQEIVNTFRHGKKNEANHAVPVIPAFQFNITNNLPIHPYVLGAWLANGNSRQASICSNDKQILNQIIRFHKYDHRKYVEKSLDYVYLKDLIYDLNKLDLVENKHIPTIYLNASYNDRLWLLRGLMDCDGYISSETHACEFGNKIQGNGFKEQFGFLLRSLGLRTSFPNVSYKTATNGTLGNKTHFFRYNFTPKAFNPFTLERKAVIAQQSLDRERSGLKKTSYRDWIYFTDYEEVQEKVPMRCIGVDAEDHLFAVGETFILTHNTELGKISASKIMFNEGEVFWITPSYKMGSQVWRDLKDTFSAIITWKSEQDRSFEILGGGSLKMFTAEHPDRMRGFAPHHAIIDEAAMIKDSDLWYAVLRPALSDHEGGALFLSTPKGRNWFFDLFMLGQTDEQGIYKSWSMPSWYNPHFRRSEALDAKRTIHEKLFLQEYAAKFLLDAGEVFIGVQQVSTLYPLMPYNGRFVIGVDLAKKKDFTVISVFDLDKREQVDLDIYNKMSWPDIKDRIIEYYKMWKPVKLLIEDNSMGESVIDDLKALGIPAMGFHTSNSSKRKIIEDMIVDIQNNSVKLINDETQLFEFQSYQMKRTPSGKIGYSAPPGMHDDTVMATCIAWSGVRNSMHTFGRALPRLSGWS